MSCNMVIGQLINLAKMVFNVNYEKCKTIYFIVFLYIFVPSRRSFHTIGNRHNDFKD